MGALATRTISKSKIEDCLQTFPRGVPHIVVARKLKTPRFMDKPPSKQGIFQRKHTHYEKSRNINDYVKRVRKTKGKFTYQAGGYKFQEGIANRQCKKKKKKKGKYNSKRLKT